MEDKKHEEIDLAAIVRGFKNVFRQLFRRIERLYDFTITNIKLLALFSAVMMLLWYGLFVVTTTYYGATAVIVHHRLNNDQCAHMIKNLGNYINPQDKNRELSRVLKLSPSDGAKIKNIAYNNQNGELVRKYSDSLVVQLPFQVVVEVYDNDVLDTLQTAILNYLESNIFASARKKLDEEILMETEARIDSEIRHLDSVKKLVNLAIVPRASGNGIIMGQPIDPVLVSKRYIELFSQKEEIKRRRKLINSFEVLVEFSRDDQKYAPEKISYLLTGAMAGYVLGLIYLALRERRRRRRAGIPV